MSVTVTYRCAGCEAEATAQVRQRFRSFSGRDHGFGVFEIDDVQSVAPEGWVPFDPYTSATYCPDCWAKIIADIDAEATP